MIWLVFHSILQSIGWDLIWTHAIWSTHFVIGGSSTAWVARARYGKSEVVGQKWKRHEKTQYQHRYINWVATWCKNVQDTFVWSSPDDLAGRLAKSTSPPTSTRTLIDSPDHGRAPRHRFQEVHELLVASFLRQVIRCFALHNYAQLKFWEMRKGGGGRINYDMLGLGLLKSGVSWVFLSGRYIIVSILHISAQNRSLRMQVW